MDGDIRLVPLSGAAAATATCDDVHFGVVELFRDGIWGLICGGRAAEKFTLDAQVICRQLGFPFGSIMDTRDFSSTYDDYSTETTTWATEVGHTQAC